MMSSNDTLPRFADVLAAAARIAAHARLTPIASSRSLDAISGARLHFKCEQLQRVGAFKFRGACNAVFALDADTAARGVVTHSSGNHGAALALASQLRGIACHVVVPEGAVRSKLEAIEASGAVLHRCAANLSAREAACAQVQADTGATLVHPYTTTEVIAGQGTAALELLTAHPDLDALVVPVGGGGLAAGTALTMQALAPNCRLFLAEPAGADDAAQSFARGVLEHDVIPDTICDGLRAGMGAINFELLRNSNARVLTVDDAQTIAAMRLLWSRGKQLVEPSSATVLAAVLANSALFEGSKVGLILSGGNVDLDALPKLFALVTASAA
ncbi:pyridoxal-phosphate dependent enzyme [Thermomonas sp.]|uniref:pyridoxal-phosphate dependent enzyme n=1 Tax=Thermomonas sp. TaxID=1971895 RepID=UPI00248720D6|nr:pyridoxal-phosphate dependent enzyme [Thermomonas sp.]MDI1252311.1 pyridoxal-phosphate dependent enzyme [Thermomonas sp.]